MFVSPLGPRDLHLYDDRLLEIVFSLLNHLLLLPVFSIPYRCADDRTNAKVAWEMMNEEMLLECPVSMPNMVTGVGRYQDGVTLNDKEEGSGVSVALFHCAVTANHSHKTDVFISYVPFSFTSFSSLFLELGRQ